MKKFILFLVLSTIIVFAVNFFNKAENEKRKIDEPVKKEQQKAKTDSSDNILKIQYIVKKPKEDIDVILGQPDSCEQIKYGSKCIYKKGKIEIVYINGLSDWITVNDLQNIPYKPDSIRFFGLEPSTPSFSNEHVTRWENAYGLLSIQFAPGGNNGIFFAYVKATTP